MHRTRSSTIDTSHYHTSIISIKNTVIVLGPTQNGTEDEID